MTSYLTSFQTGIGVYFIGDRRLITQARQTDHPWQFFVALDIQILERLKMKEKCNENSPMDFQSQSVNLHLFTVGFLAIPDLIPSVYLIESGHMEMVHYSSMTDDG